MKQFKNYSNQTGPIQLFIAKITKQPVKAAQKPTTIHSSIWERHEKGLFSDITKGLF